MDFSVAKLKSSLNPRSLAQYTISQLNAYYPDGDRVLLDHLMPIIPESLRRLEHCFSYVDNRYFFDGEASVFNHLHGDQYAMWLYILSNELFLQRGDSNLCSKLFLLNKQLHACDIFYEVSLPSVFLLVHPLGTVLGRGNYSDFFVAYQRCGIGSNHDIYPTLGRHLTLRPGSAILGDSNIGENCQIASETLVIDTDLPAGSTIFGNPSNHRFRKNSELYSLWRKRP
jgi:serine O-acetyltransferase